MTLVPVAQPPEILVPALLRHGIDHCLVPMVQDLASDARVLTRPRIAQTNTTMLWRNRQSHTLSQKSTSWLGCLAIRTHNCQAPTRSETGVLDMFLFAGTAMKRHCIMVSVRFALRQHVFPTACEIGNALTAGLQDWWNPVCVLLAGKSFHQGNLGWLLASVPQLPAS